MPEVLVPITIPTSVGAKAFDGIVHRRSYLAQRGQGELIVAAAVAQGKFVETRQWQSRIDSAERQRAAGRIVFDHRHATLRCVQHTPPDVSRDRLPNETDHSELVKINHA